MIHGVYNIKVLEHLNYPIKWDAADKGKINQNRKTTAAKVTKSIATDTDNDNQYKQYLVLNYRKSITVEFKLVPTNEGFAVRMDYKTLKYFAKEGTYFIDNNDQNFFIDDEFQVIG